MVLQFEPSIFQYTNAGWGNGYREGAGYLGSHLSPNARGQGYFIISIMTSTSGLGYKAALFKVSP